MSQMSQNEGKPVSVAIVGKSALFPVALVPKAFWPNLLSLKGLMAGLATAQWPFNEFFSTQDLKNLKGFVMESGLLTSGGLPAEGFEIPPEVLKISTVLPVVGLFLAKQALDDTRSFQKGGICADQVRVVLETRFPTVDTASQTLSRPDVADLFARHFGFTVCQIDGSAPLPGTLSWLGNAVRELQGGSADLVIAGSVDAVHSVLAWTEKQPASGSADPRLREGLGMIALRRLCDAERDGDQILAVISGFDASSICFERKTTGPAAPAPMPAPIPAPMTAPGRLEQFAHFARLPVSDIIVEADGSCRNLPFNHLPKDGSNAASLDWKLVRERWVQRTGSCRFFHDLLGALLGTFVNRVVVQKPDAFAEVASRPLVFLANHQIGLESPLFMALAYGMTGLPIEAVAKPDHVNAWLAFLLAFAQDSLGDGNPFRLMYSERQNPQGLIDNLKKAGKREASLLVHVEGTRASAANQPVTRLSSVFLDMAIDKNLPLVPLRFVGGLPVEPSEERLDFPFGNGKQDYLIGAPIMPEQLKKMPYGQRPRFLMELINTLGPGPGEDILLPSDKTFESKTRFFIDTFGFPKMQAMLFAILQMIDDPCEETAQLIAAVQSGKVDPRSPNIPPVLKSFLGHIKTKFA
ncbi:MAG: 1-acyl-sn-glycerol-3-phosphate acyltransferase [Candidatus Riflebacteria bacterium]|nr:1-acyl-sn-glycerol-3-phosphate acyltransferase [Candidatus Riflebacteria bacterium]